MSRSPVPSWHTTRPDRLAVLTGRGAGRTARLAGLTAVVGLMALGSPAASATSLPLSDSRPFAAPLAGGPAARAAATTTTGISTSYFCGPANDGPATDDVARDVHALPRFKVVYAHASDDPNRFATYADLIARTMATTSGIVADNSGTKGVRLDLGTACGPNVVDITVVQLPKTRSYYTAITPDQEKSRFFEIAGQVRTALGPAPGGQRRNTVIWADQLRFGPQAGVADDTTNAIFYGDPDPVSNGTAAGGLTAMILGAELFGPPASDDFLHDGGPSAAELPAYHAVVALHEMIHTMGGVLASAPNANTEGHCTDEYDLMCYGAGVTYPCPDADGDLSFRLDCGRDDYFRPEGGLVTATGKPAWNVHDSPFLCAIATCATGDGAPPTAELPAVSGAAGTPVTLDASGSADDTGAVRYRWDLDGKPGYEVATEGVPRVTTTVPASGAAPVAVRVYDADGRTATATSTVSVATPPDPGSGSPPSPPGGGGSGAPVTSAPKVISLRLVGGRRRGTKLRATFRLSASARTTVELLRRAPGRRQGKTCSTKAKKGRRCTTFVRVRRKTVNVTSTTARTVALGRIARAGRYVVRVTPAGGKARTAVLRTR